MQFTCRDDNNAKAHCFQELECLRLFIRQVQLDHVPSLDYFAYDGGYQHYKGKLPLKLSASSSATCILSLVATGKWNEDPIGTRNLLEKLLARKKSAGLEEENPFTLAWILEAVTALIPYSETLTSDSVNRIEQIEKILQKAVSNGGVSIEPYPPSAYLTQLVVRALRRRAKLPVELEEAVNRWAWAELTRQLALIQAQSKTQDSFAVAYLLMLVTAVTPRSKISPEQASIQRTALKTFFECQLEDGTWPLSRPLFHYPKFGNAYCYEYEMLTQLLQEAELGDLLLDYLPKLSSAAESVSRSVYRVEGGIPAWTSGHHPNQGDPESWATASVYHFLHSLDRLLAEAVRQELFRYLEFPLPRTTSPKNRNFENFAPLFLDSEVEIRGKKSSLRQFLWEAFVKPLSGEMDGIAFGRTFRKGTPRAAIFFGPPGTSKTDLSRIVAVFLGWPLVKIDPSLLLRKGMDGIQVEANAIFRILEETERVVVLFDEFDELVKERGSANSEPFSRLLTTAMLPKLANIHKRASLVFIIATNHIAQFDLAIRRQGRFDRVVQVMPPTYEAKIAKHDWGPNKDLDLEKRLRELKVDITEEIKNHIADLTFDECDLFVTDLFKTESSQAVATGLAAAWDQCTLQTSVSQEQESTTWNDRCKSEASLSR
jgi:ATPase family associated with various cellular activities (AAA)